MRYARTKDTSNKETARVKHDEEATSNLCKVGITLATYHRHYTPAP